MVRRISNFKPLFCTVQTLKQVTLLTSRKECHASGKYDLPYTSISNLGSRFDMITASKRNKNRTLFSNEDSRDPFYFQTVRHLG